ncbi:unnamed protein product [Schistosoma mattheei]|uniref:Uncharacterized protein n=1 Tax=Schistosoma mattheei TaxID=31246 RepID=A0A183PXM1_9TREM|nr:unnamed protein product [Schistosoma mattheei]
MRELYDIRKKLSRNHRKLQRPVKSNEGEVITNNEKQRNRCVEHFENFLNRPASLNPIDVGPPTIEEISMAFRQIKSGKAPGPDNIPAETLKADVSVTARILRILSNKIWDKERVPKDWKEGFLIKMQKADDLGNYDNYRSITLLSKPGKVFNRLLLNRMNDSVDAQLRDQQAGFFKDRSCTDQISTLRIIVEQSIE